MKKKYIQRKYVATMYIRFEEEEGTVDENEEIQGFEERLSELGAEWIVYDVDGDKETPIGRVFCD